MRWTAGTCSILLNLLAGLASVSSGTYDPVVKIKSEAPKESAGDWLHAVAKGSLGSIPIVGGVVSEVFGLVVAPPISRRRDKFMEEVANSLKRIEEKGGVSLYDLSKNETLVDTVLQATQAAIRTPSEMKRTFLKNAVINAAKPHAPDAAAQQMFVNFVDRFTEWHLRLLDLFSGPPDWAKKNNVRFHELHMGSANHLVESTFPELAARREFCRQVWRDLYYM